MSVDKFGRMPETNIRNVDGVSISYVNNNFLRRAGTNTATGSINMAGNTLTNVSDPVNAQDVATKSYVDKSGGTMSGELNMNGNKIIGLDTDYPPLYKGDEAVSWAQTVGLTQDAIHALVNKRGDTMTGDLDMGHNRVKNISLNPVDTSDAANAAFVIQGDITVEQKAVLRSGTQAMSGHLNMDNHYINNVLDPADPQDVATKKYVDGIVMRRRSILYTTPITSSNTATINSTTNPNWRRIVLSITMFKYHQSLTIFRSQVGLVQRLVVLGDGLPNESSFKFQYMGEVILSEASDNIVKITAQNFGFYIFTDSIPYTWSPKDHHLNYKITHVEIS